MNQDDALREAKLVGGLCRFEVRIHAIERMASRGVSRSDIANALKTATVALYQEDGCWRFEGGVDEEKDPLIVVARFTQKCVIITIF
ncbi:MAG: hypothetical protein B6A08_00170 [Sorangiineae bacterium NIC37A_2]|nr:MAG: hypothetical protein B6A08_00170 [Sorangiineae bacterium NIC37A_2]